ncbi:MAG: hypothetical protein RSO15_09805 [Bacteroides sp.]|uniref:hypothetical protein n=1 Tax=Bacteroides sp. TaxID=29523 RepID=UPI002FC5ED03
MYNTSVFETAMNSCGYKIEEIKYTDKSRQVRQVIGMVRIPRKVTINGDRKTIFKRKKFRWDASGHCFSLQSNVRQRRYDLPIPTIVEFQKQEESQSQM